MVMQCALMWIALCALMKELMSLLNFVGQEKLLQNGLQGLIIQMDFYIFLKEGLCFWISLVSLLLYLIYVLNFHRAMGGSVPFEEALAARLSLFNPSLSQLENFLQQRPPRYDWDRLNCWVFSVFFFVLSSFHILMIINVASRLRSILLSIWLVITLSWSDSSYSPIALALTWQSWKVLF